MFIKNIDLPPNIEVGAYTYYDDPAGKDAFVKNVLYHFEFTGDHLLIGKFCCLATGTKFIMNGGNHRPDAFTTYPFVIFGGEWSNRFAGEADFPNRGDTIIGNDVWTGWNTTILPGVKIGNGAVIGASSVVTKDVPPYAIVAGNPARVVKMRFSDEVIKLLEQLKWWDWSIDKITENIPILSSNDLQQLKRLITC